MFAYLYYSIEMRLGGADIHSLLAYVSLPHVSERLEGLTLFVGSISTGLCLLYAPQSSETGSKLGEDAHPNVLLASRTFPKLVVCGGFDPVHRICNVPARSVHSIRPMALPFV